MNENQSNLLIHNYEKQYCGAQNEFISNLMKNNITSLRNEFYKFYNDNNFTEKYEIIFENYTYYQKCGLLEYHLSPTYDFIDNFYLAINKNNLAILDKIESISLRINQFEINRIYLDTYQECILNFFDTIFFANKKDNCKFLNFINNQSHNNKLISLPLFDMLPFNENVKIIIKLKDSDLNIDEYIEHIKLFGCKYKLNDPENNVFKDKVNEFIITQIQYTGQEVIINNSVRLNHNHPILLLYFYGIDIDTINNVELKFDGEIYHSYNKKQIKKFNDQNVGFITFDQTLFNIKSVNKNFYELMTVNFSRIDNIKLIFNIENKEKDLNNENHEIKIFALGFNTVRFFNDKIGLTFSK